MAQELETKVQDLTLPEVASNYLCLLLATSARHLGQHDNLTASDRWTGDVKNSQSLFSKSHACLIPGTWLSLASKHLNQEMGDCPVQ